MIKLFLMNFFYSFSSKNNSLSAKASKAQNQHKVLEGEIVKIEDKS